MSLNVRYMWHQSSTNTITNTINFILHRIKNNETLVTSYFSIVNMYNIIRLFTIKINLKHYTHMHATLKKRTLVGSRVI